MRKRSVRAVLALLPALASLAGVGGAQAHSLINAGNVYDNGNQCVYNWTAQAHTYNSMLVRSLTDTPPYYFPMANCTYSNAKPAGYLAGRWESWKWGPNVGAWLVCGTQGWNYGGGVRAAGRPVDHRLRRWLLPASGWSLRLQRRLGGRLADNRLRVALVMKGVTE